MSPGGQVTEVKVDMVTKNTQKGPDLLVKRDKSAPRMENRHWSDSRAWLSSCIFHTLLFVSLVLFWRPISKGTQGELDRPVGIALVHQTSQGTEYVLSGGGASTRRSEQDSQSKPTIQVSTPGVSPLETLVADLLPSQTVADNSGATNVGTSVGSGAGNVAGTDRGSVKGLNSVKTTFLGVEGNGSSFVYVIDRSDSMNVRSAAPMSVAKRELLNSLDSLKDSNQFQIVFYNDSPTTLLSPQGSTNRLLFAKATEKSRASRFVRGVVANGGTEHVKALKIGLSFAPDVLFFMTDGELPGLTQSELTDVRERALKAGTTIHTIQFRAGEPESDGGWIRALADTNRGTYRYVNVEELLDK